MKRYSNQEIIAEIKNGREEILSYFGKKYFPSARKMMRMRGIPDSQTPAMFSSTLASVVMSFLKRRTISDIDIDAAFYNALKKAPPSPKRVIKESTPSSAGLLIPPLGGGGAIASHCVAVLDKQFQELLFSRIIERMSYEDIATRFQYSNAVIAQHEFHKALNQLEEIVKIRIGFRISDSKFRIEEGAAVHSEIINSHSEILIDRYLQGDLSGVELENFKQRLIDDDTFMKQVELGELIYAGVHLAKEHELENKILGSIDYRKPAIPYPLKLIMVFLAIMTLGITFWFYVGNEGQVINEKLKDPNGVWSKARNVFSRKIAPAPVHRQVETTSSEEEALADSTNSGNNIPIQPGSSTTVNKDSATLASDENIVVKQDQLLITTTLPVIDKTTDEKNVADHSLTTEAVEKMNPAADLPVEEGKSTTFDVEFWVSPVNYKGYKMSKNKLLLFGIDEPDAVKLFRMNDAIYMSYLKDYYKLTTTYEFLPYQKLKDPEIPLALSRKEN